jgi:histidine triad (HIT) family protein
MPDNCLFCKIIAGQIPAKKIYEDDKLVAFHDIHPIAQVHFLIVPKKHIESLLSTETTDVPLLGHLFGAVPLLAKEQGLQEGFRTMINSGVKGGQTVFHLHVHVFGGGGKAESLIAQMMQ